MVAAKENGFSLMEVLVSMLVLGLGVIGSAGMQMAAMRTTQQSGFQTFALQLAAEMADAIRANGGGGPAKSNIEPFADIDYQSATEGEPPQPAKLCYASACDAEELAEFEAYDWKKRIKDALPGGRILICHDSTPWDSAGKRLTWECSGGAKDGASLVIKLGWQTKNPDGSLVKDADGQFPPSVALPVAL